jgi:hypothetical protein
MVETTISLLKFWQSIAVLRNQEIINIVMVYADCGPSLSENVT